MEKNPLSIPPRRFRQFLPFIGPDDPRLNELRNVVASLRIFERESAKQQRGEKFNQVAIDCCSAEAEWLAAEIKKAVIAGDEPAEAFFKDLLKVFKKRREGKRLNHVKLVIFAFEKLFMAQGVEPTKKQLWECFCAENGEIITRRTFDRILGRIGLNDLQPDYPGRPLSH